MEDYYTEHLKIDEKFKDNDIFLKIHKSEEKWELWNTDLEAHYLKNLKQIRTYVHAKPYYLFLTQTITIGIYNKQQEGNSIGEVLNSNFDGVRQYDLGNAQAWFYHLDKVLTLWECFLHERERQKIPSEDKLLINIWNSFENYLIEQFSPTLIVAPAWEPIYEDKLWEDFLINLGYTIDSKIRFGFKKL